MLKLKKRKRLSSFVMTVFLSIFLILNASLVNAETNDRSLIYTALGDSIGAGYSADPGKGYVDLIYNYLKVQNRYSGLQLNNKSVPGMTTTDLLGYVNTNTTLQNSIKSSSIITLSIGGNNLLKPVIAAVATGFGVNFVNNPNLLPELFQAVTMKSESDKAQIFSQIFSQLANPTSPLSIGLVAGVQQFNTDFPLIITQIRTLAPQAKIYIPTLYNPFNTSDPCYGAFNQLIQTINVGIIASSANNYQVADVYTAFASHTGTPVVNFNFLLGAVDPHPTTEGHKVIFESHVTPVSAVTLNETSKTLEIGQTIQLTVAVLPADAITNPDVVWNSSNSNIATVDTNGKVTFISKGAAIITAASKDGNKIAKCTITVTNSAAKVGTTNTTLPQTGSLLDFDVMFSLGMIILTLGVVLIVTRKVRS